MISRNEKYKTVKGWFGQCFAHNTIHKTEIVYIILTHDIKN